MIEEHTHILGGLAVFIGFVSFFVAQLADRLFAKNAVKIKVVSYSILACVMCSLYFVGNEGSLKAKEQHLEFSEISDAHKLVDYYFSQCSKEDMECIVTVLDLNEIAGVDSSKWSSAVKDYSELFIVSDD